MKASPVSIVSMVLCAVLFVQVAFLNLRLNTLSKRLSDQRVMINRLTNTVVKTSSDLSRGVSSNTESIEKLTKSAVSMLEIVEDSHGQGSAS